MKFFTEDALNHFMSGALEMIETPQYLDKPYTLKINYWGTHLYLSGPFQMIREVVDHARNRGWQVTELRHGARHIGPQKGTLDESDRLQSSP